MKREAHRFGGVLSLPSHRMRHFVGWHQHGSHRGNKTRHAGCYHYRVTRRGVVPVDQWLKEKQRRENRRPGLPDVMVDRLAPLSHQLSWRHSTTILVCTSPIIHRVCYPESRSGVSLLLSNVSIHALFVCSAGPAMFQKVAEKSCPPGKPSLIQPSWCIRC